MQRIQIKTLKLVRAEGPSAECGPAKISTTGLQAMQDAQTQLRRWADTAPAKGGYDKCDFDLEFEDGSQYDGRYDLKHWSLENVDLPGHMRGFLEYYSGRHCPAWLKAERNGMQRYQQVVSSLSEAERNRCLAFIAYYEFGQGEVTLPDEPLVLGETAVYQVRMHPDAALEVRAMPHGVPAVRFTPDESAARYATLFAVSATSEASEAELAARCEAILAQAQTPPVAWPEGRRVLHDALGYGTVIQGGDSDVVVRFDDPVAPECHVAQVFANRLTQVDN